MIVKRGLLKKHLRYTCRLPNIFKAFLVTIRYERSSKSRSFSSCFHSYIADYSVVTLAFVEPFECSHHKFILIEELNQQWWNFPKCFVFVIVTKILNCNRQGGISFEDTQRSGSLWSFLSLQNNSSQSSITSSRSVSLLGHATDL